MLVNDIIPVPLVAESNRCAAAETMMAIDVWSHMPNGVKDVKFGIALGEMCSILWTGSRSDGLSIPLYYDRILNMPMVPDVDMLCGFSNLHLDVSTGRKVHVFESVSHEPNSSYGKLCPDMLHMRDGTVQKEYISLLTSVRKYFEQNTLLPSSLNLEELMLGPSVYEHKIYEVPWSSTNSCS